MINKFSPKSKSISSKFMVFNSLICHRSFYWRGEVVWKSVVEFSMRLIFLWFFNYLKVELMKAGRKRGFKKEKSEIPDHLYLLLLDGIRQAFW
jgi:hypothetical protein